MINRVVLVGRLARDVNFQKTNTGLSLARFTIACDRVGSRNANGQSAADFISCIAWRQSADYLSQYAHKGDMVAVEGRITTGSYDKNDGSKVYTTDVTCDRVSLVNSNRNNNSINNNVNAMPTPTINEPVMNNANDFSDIVSGPTIDISSDDLPF